MPGGPDGGAPSCAPYAAPAWAEPTHATPPAASTAACAHARRPHTTGNHWAQVSAGQNYQWTSPLLPLHHILPPTTDTTLRHEHACQSRCGHVPGRQRASIRQASTVQHGAPPTARENTPPATRIASTSSVLAVWWRWSRKARWAGISARRCAPAPLRRPPRHLRAAGRGGLARRGRLLAARRGGQPAAADRRRRLVGTAPPAPAGADHTRAPGSGGSAPLPEDRLAPRRAVTDVGPQAGGMRADLVGLRAVGLVSVAVQLYSASPEARPKFHEVHAADGSRCATDAGVRATRARCRRRRSRGAGKHSTAGWWVLEEQDLDALPLPTRKTVELLGFTDEARVNGLTHRSRSGGPLPPTDPGADILLSNRDAFGPAGRRLPVGRLDGHENA
jgi:hypothetical protein